MRLFSLATTQGNAQAQANLAHMKAGGHADLPRGPDLALDWAQEASSHDLR
jgi:TPR repeat protein